MSTSGGSGGGTISPLTTKGDLWGFSTTNARVPVGADGTVATADSTQALGVKWGAVGASTLPVYAQSRVSGAANLSSNSSTPVEISSSLRVTVVVPASGKVVIFQNIVVSITNGSNDIVLSVQVDGTGAWTTTGAMNSNNSNEKYEIPGQVVLTGLTPGSHTFYMGWNQAGGGTMNCRALDFGGVNQGTWQSVLTLP